MAQAGTSIDSGGVVLTTTVLFLGGGGQECLQHTVCSAAPKWSGDVDPLQRGCIGTREYSETQASNQALGCSVTSFLTVHSEQADSRYYDQSITNGFFSIPS